MAITKVGAMTDPPAEGDFSILQAKLDAYAKQIGNQGMILTQWTNTTTTPAIAMGSYITHGGTLFVVDTEDFAVPAPAGDGTYYLKVATSGATIAISWVESTAGYTWNAIYNGLYHADESQILPYQLVKAGETLTKRKITNLMQGSGFVTVDWTGHTNYIDQGVKTTDTVGFVNIKPSFIPALNAGDTNNIEVISGQSSFPVLNTWVEIPSLYGNIKYRNALVPSSAIYSNRIKIYVKPDRTPTSLIIRVKKNGTVIYTSDTITPTASENYVTSIDVIYNIADMFSFEVYRTGETAIYTVKVYTYVDREYTKLESLLGDFTRITT